MRSNPDPLASADLTLHLPHPASRASACLLALLTVALVACSASPRGRPTADRGASAPPGAGSPAGAAPPALAASVPAAPAPDATARALAHAERVRLMQPAELNQELARLTDAAAPADQLALAVVLSQLRQLPELIRAQEVLARVLGNSSADAEALHPLARLLASRYGEQRRLEEQLEKQNQQTRDVQRRLEQTNERLEALKAIERSLTSRPPVPVPVPPPAPAAATPASRSRASAP